MPDNSKALAHINFIEKQRWCLRDEQLINDLKRLSYVDQQVRKSYKPVSGKRYNQTK